MKVRKKKLILLVVNLVIVGIVIFGFRAWLEAIPEKQVVETPILSEIEEELAGAGFGERFAHVPIVRNYEKVIEKIGWGGGAGLALGTTEFETEDYNQFVEIYLEPKNNFRDELILLMEGLVDEKVNGLTNEKQNFGYVKYYATRNESGGNLMVTNDIYRYVESNVTIREFNIEKITENGKLVFVYNFRDGHIIGMILLGILIAVVVIVTSLYLLYVVWDY